MAIEQAQEGLVAPGRARRPGPAWQRRFQRDVVVGDLVVALAVAALAVMVHAQENGRVVEAGYWYTSALVPFVWVAALAAAGAYESRVLGSGSEEYKRVVNTGLRVSAVVTFVFFLAEPEVSRRYTVMLLVGCTVLTEVGRYVLRQTLHRRRLRGEDCYRVLALGNHHDVVDLVRAIRRDPTAGLTVVSACLSDGVHGSARSRGGLHPPVEVLRLTGEPVPIVGTNSLRDVLASVAAVDADMVALTASPGLSTLEVRELGWELEALDVGLVVAPALTNVAGPRIHIRPVSGLPLLHVEDPNLHGAAQRLKSVIERVMAAMLLLFLSPLLGAVALAIRLDSKGPAIFTQQRMGRDGLPFTIHKFRTMKVGADAEFVDLIEASDTPEGLFWKMRQDPRITKVGSFLRRYSLDELPQLINVVGGTMSLVGPRPLPVEVEQDGAHVRRRLLVRPGMTGLWQISGRSDLPWEEALRFDLYYVENWSLAFDVMIMWKTVFVVARSDGAY